MVKKKKLKKPVIKIGARKPLIGKRKKKRIVKKVRAIGSTLKRGPAVPRLKKKTKARLKSKARRVIRVEDVKRREMIVNRQGEPQLDPDSGNQRYEMVSTGKKRFAGGAASETRRGVKAVKGQFAKATGIGAKGRYVVNKKGQKVYVSGKEAAVRSAKKTRSRIMKFAAAIDGGVNPVTGSSKSKRRGPKRRPGRPTGVYKYAIPGKGPVHVYEYRKWIRDQRAQARTTPDPTDDYAAEAQYNEYHGREPPQQMEEQYEEAPQAPQRRVPQQANQPGGPIDIMKTAPERNILRAPNVMRGELQNTAPKYNDAPADEGDRPVTNPGGEYYVEIEPASGKRILRRRPREKWSRS